MKGEVLEDTEESTLPVSRRRGSRRERKEIESWTIAEESFRARSWKTPEPPTRQRDGMGHHLS